MQQPGTKIKLDNGVETLIIARSSKYSLRNEMYRLSRKRGFRVIDWCWWCVFWGLTTHEYGNDRRQALTCTNPANWRCVLLVLETNNIVLEHKNNFCVDVVRMVCFPCVWLCFICVSFEFTLGSCVFTLRLRCCREHKKKSWTHAITNLLRMVTSCQLYNLKHMVSSIWWLQISTSWT